MIVTAVPLASGADRRPLPDPQAAATPRDTFAGILAAAADAPAAIENLVPATPEEPDAQQAAADPDDPEAGAPAEHEEAAQPAERPGPVFRASRDEAGAGRAQEHAAPDAAFMPPAAPAEPGPDAAPLTRSEAGAGPLAPHREGYAQLAPQPPEQRGDDAGRRRDDARSAPPLTVADRHQAGSESSRASQVAQVPQAAQVSSAASAGPVGLAHLESKAVPSPEGHGGWGTAGAADSLRPVALASAPTAASAPPAAVGQLVVAIRTSDAERFELRLNPPELGRVQIEMRLVDGALHAVLLTERAETAELLRRHAETLQRDLEAAGYDSVSLSFGAGGRENSNESAQPYQAAATAPAAPAALAPSSSAAVAGAASALGHLDIRL